MSVIIFSVHGQQYGEGSKNRIISIIDAIKQSNADKKICWVNVCPISYKDLFSLNLIRKRYQTFGVDRKLLFVSSFINRFIVGRKILQAVLFIYFLVMNRNTPRPLFVIEMTTSYWPLEMYLKKYKHKVVLDIHGTIDEMIQDERQSPDLKKYLNGVKDEITSSLRADYIICVSKRMAELYKSKYLLHKKKIFVIPTTPDVNKFYFDSNNRTEKRRQLGIDGKFVFIYSGGIHYWQGIDLSMKIFDALRKSEEFRCQEVVLIMLVWDKRFSLENKCAELQIANEGIIHFSVPMDQVTHYLQCADIGCMLRNNTTTNIVSSPTKAGEYLLSGLPILTTPHVGDYSPLIEQHNLGLMWDIEKSIDSQIQPLAKFCLSINGKREEFSNRCQTIAKEYYSAFGLNQLNALHD